MGPLSTTSKASPVMRLRSPRPIESMNASESARTGKLEMSRFQGLSPGNTGHEPMCGPVPGAAVLMEPAPAPPWPFESSGPGLAPGPCPEPEPQPHRPNAARPASPHPAVRRGISGPGTIPMAVQTAQNGREFRREVTWRWPVSVGILAGVSKTYTRREADEILRRALAVQPAEGISHDDLVAAAREVGIPGEAIEAAAQQLGEDQRISERAALIRRRRRMAFLRHLLIYLVVNAGMFFVDHADGGAYWFQYPLIIWGVILAAVGIAQLAPDQRSLARRAERELEREQRRAQRRMRAAARRDGAGAARGGAKEF